MTMLALYKTLSQYTKPALKLLLKRRLAKGKEDPARIKERKGKASRLRENGPLIWVHAASVGEAQSALILLDHIQSQYPDLHILMTTGTRTSATLMGRRLSGQAFHQYYPLDHKDWVERFLDHWRPDLALWMESELWPNMLSSIQARRIPTILLNARLSPRSYKRWQAVPKTISQLLQSFDLIIAQTNQDAEYYQSLSHQNVTVRPNIKYGAAPLTYNNNDLKTLQTAIKKRPVWVYASTHDGEEQLACRLHLRLQKDIPNLLTIIVPRHPERGRSVLELCENAGLDSLTRTELKRLPDADTQIYIADTLGELGLFYSLSPIACIGRSFSRDGGGGHNPIEAAQLGCAVLSGPHIQNLQDIYDDMKDHHAYIPLKDENNFYETLKSLLTDPEQCRKLQKTGQTYALEQSEITQDIIKDIEPYLVKVISKP